VSESITGDVSLFGHLKTERKDWGSCLSQTSISVFNVTHKYMIILNMPFLIWSWP